jgi:hypothetical protein
MDCFALPTLTGGTGAVDKREEPVPPERVFGPLDSDRKGKGRFRVARRRQHVGHEIMVVDETKAVFSAQVERDAVCFSEVLGALPRY